MFLLPRNAVVLQCFSKLHCPCVCSNADVIPPVKYCQSYESTVHTTMHNL